MAAFLKGLKGTKAAESPISSGDSDFADFAGAPVASPEPFASVSAPAAAATNVPFTKWYNVHERHSLSEFKHEGAVIVVIFFVVLIHLWGTRTNRAKAKAWLAAHKETLAQEYSLVGFATPRHITVDQIDGDGLAKTLANEPAPIPDDLKELTPYEFASYATGRQNVAFVDFKLTLQKRYNPLTVFSENVLSFFFESMPAPQENIVAVAYPFDGKESQIVPGQIPGAHETRSNVKSAFDGFVWAVVNKDNMKTLREDRYDISITATKDNAKLPAWTTVMSESAEITDTLLTPELIKCIEQAGDLFRYLIISDQPIDKPLSLDETEPKKRVFFSTAVPSSASDYEKTLPLFKYFLRLPDYLVQVAHFRPEVIRKLQTVRNDAIKEIKKAEDKIKAEERELERDKAKKMKRDAELRGLDANAQKKYLEKEKAREQKKMSKKMTTRA